MGGISIFVFLYFRFFYQGYSQYQVSNGAIFASMTLTWIINFPHFTASSYYLYQSKERRQKFKGAAYLAPISLAIIVGICLHYQNTVAPYFLKAFSIWSPYHYCAQTFGLILIYAKRGNFAVDSTNRKILSATIFSAFIYQYIEVESKLNTILVGSIQLPKLGIPALVGSFFFFTSVISGAFLAFRFFRSSQQQKRILPWVALVPLLSHYIWFLTDFEIFSFQTVVPIFHGLQYLLLAWSVEAHEKKSVHKSRWKTSSIWAGANVILAGILMYVLPNFLGQWAMNFTAFSTILFSAIQAHHFIIDAYIWKSNGDSNHSMFTAGQIEHTENEILRAA